MTRSRVVKVRVTQAEYSDWTEMALRDSVSLSETIRRAMQGNPHLESPKPLESLPVAQEEFPGILISECPPYAEVGDIVRSQATGETFRVTEDASTRRKELCPHGKPGFAFCPECDQ